MIEHKTRYKHQNENSLSKKTEFYEKQEQKEADRPDIKGEFSLTDKETYDSLPLTRWLDKSGKLIEDHPEMPREHRETKILGRRTRIPVVFLLKSKLVRETLNATGYDLDEVEKGRAVVGQDLVSLLKN